MEIKNNNNIATISDIFPTITSWNIDGIDILFPEQEVLIDGKQKKRGGTPLCFPNFGHAVTYKGVEIPQHGFLRDKEHQFIRTNGTGPRLFLRGNVQAYNLSYDTSILMQVHNQFNIPTLTQTLTVKSGISSEEMPLCLGFHPYFKINRKYLNFIRDGKAMNMGLFDNEGLLHAQKYDFKNTFEIQIDEKVSVIMCCIGDFVTGQQQVCIWSDNPDQYICVEPIMHKSELFGTSQGYFVESKEQTFHVSYACKRW
ncbi:MAG: hypothetical protein WCL02_01630 [bacterium]